MGNTKVQRSQGAKWNKVIRPQLAQQQMENDVTAALMTMLFLVAGWAALTAVFVVLDDSGSKIRAALKGNSMRLVELAQVRQVTVRFNQRYPAPRSQPVRATAEWRAAA